ncbi:MAG: HlyC/CorC family transporter [Acidobacteria bacterium]|nr:HlyC/CorC family transporter [Acidobacteriota bacterium]
MLSIALHVLVIATLTFFLALFSYIYRLCQERGREESRRIREHAEHFHHNIAPHFRMDRRRAVQTFALLSQLTLVLSALAIGYAAETFADSPAQAVFETAFFVVLQILLTYQFLPYVLMSRSSGDWLVPLVPLLRGFGYAVLPLLVVFGFCLSLLHLSEEEETPAPEPPNQAIEELVEAGQERGLLEKADVPLIASVLQFADKTAREVMTPRPEVVAIAAEASVAELRQLMQEKRFSRIPVYGQSLDEVKGVVFVRDVLEVPDAEAPTRRVSELMRPVMFVPETKPVVELIRDLQREMQPLAMVVDEYGGTAGLITPEDLAEEILGEINDADQVRRAEIARESDGTYLVRGGIQLDRLRETLGVPLEGREVTTFAGLVHAWFGYVPKPGESIEQDGIKVEVLEATPRRVVRLRVTALAPALPAPKKSRRRPRAQ